MGSLSHRLTMLADVERGERPYRRGRGSETLDVEDVDDLQDLACFVTVLSSERRATTDLDTGIARYVMLVEQGTDIKIEDCVSNVRRADGTVYLAGPVDVTAVMPHEGFGPHTTNLTECHLRLIGG